MSDCTCCGTGCDCGCAALCSIHVDRTDGTERTPVEWAASEMVIIVDPDGWRHDLKAFTDPLTWPEYERRRWVSTIAPIGAGWGEKR